MRISYTIELLKDIATRDNAKILDEYKKLNIETKIEFQCSCNNIHEKVYRVVVNHGGLFCKVCTQKNKMEKRKKTNLEKYGVEHALQLKETHEKKKKTNLEKYGFENAMKTDEVKQKVKKSMLEKYGVECALQIKEVKEKIKQTTLEKYGVEHLLQVKEIREKGRKTKKLESIKKGETQYDYETLIKCKIRDNAFLDETEYNDNTKLEKESSIKFVCNCGEKHKKTFGRVVLVGLFCNTCTTIIKKNKLKQTNLERYGVENTFQSELFKEKIKQTNLEKYGVEHVSQSNEIKKKIKITNLEKYGVENVSQNSQIAEKKSESSFGFKQYILPSGKTILIQGYEPFALDILLKEFSEEDIVYLKEEVPEIWWKDKEQKMHRHFVDFYIKSLNKCIEVKSEWTITLSNENILEKQKAGKELGYLYEIWILGTKGELINKIE